jgi:hypothetical protein
MLKTKTNPSEKIESSHDAEIRQGDSITQLAGVAIVADFNRIV